MVESETFPTGCNDTCPGTLGEREGTDGQLWSFEHTDIIGDFSNYDGDFSLFVGHVLRETVEAYRWLVDLGHVEAFDDGGAECRVGTAGEEFVEFDEEAGVWVGSFNYLG